MSPITMLKREKTPMSSAPPLGRSTLPVQDLVIIEDQIKTLFLNLRFDPNQVISFDSPLIFPFSCAKSNRPVHCLLEEYFIAPIDLPITHYVPGHHNLIILYFLISLIRVFNYTSALK
jgi:hypothetical protein